MSLPTLRVDPAEVKHQREIGWPDLHPEDFCHRCGGRNVHAWFTDNATWNQVFGGDESPILCPQCFTEIYEHAVGEHPVWELRLDVAPPAEFYDAVLAILEGNPHASQSYLAHRIAQTMTTRNEAKATGGSDG